MASSRVSFARPGCVSLFVSEVPVEGISAGFLEGTDALLMWLFVDFGIAIDGAYSTHWTPHRQPGPLASLFADLHGADAFSERAIADAGRRGIAEASFALALYDLAFTPAALRLAPDYTGRSAFLRFLGAYDGVLV
ncbi:MAG: hypothetical protein AAGA56_27060 [Myxococcota bacterium]